MKILVQLFWNNICSTSVSFCWSVLFFILLITFTICSCTYTSLYTWLEPWKRMTVVFDVWWNSHVCFPAKPQKCLPDFISGDSCCFRNVIPAIFKKDKLLLDLPPACFPPNSSPPMSCWVFMEQGFCTASHHWLVFSSACVHTLTLP